MRLFHNINKREKNQKRKNGGDDGFFSLSLTKNKNHPSDYDRGRLKEAFDFYKTMI